MRREELIGQLLTIGFTGTEAHAELREQVDYIRPGGFVLFKRNVGDPQQVRRLTDELRTFAADYPAFVCVDQEGGLVARLRAPFTEFPGNRAIANAYKAEKSTVYAGEQAAVFARELRNVGFNWNFAPVLDVDSNAENPVIGVRAFSSDPEEVSELGIAFAEAMEAGGVLSCGKHAPGHGNTSKDSHHDLPVEDVDLSTMRERELIPFQAYAKAKLAALMTAHVVYTKIDPNLPATMSEKVMQQIVRGEIGFEGVVVTDDMEMKAIDDRYGMEEAAIRTIVAGVDVLLICHTPEKQREAYEALVAEDRKSSVFRDRVDAALGRITKLKRKITAPPPFDPHAIGRANAVRLAETLQKYAAAPDGEDPTNYRG